MKMKIMKIGSVSFLLLGSFLLKSQMVIADDVRILASYINGSVRLDPELRQEMNASPVTAPIAKFMLDVMMKIKEPNLMVDPSVYYLEETAPKEGWLKWVGMSPIRGARAVGRGAWGGVQRVYTAGKERRLGALWEKGIGVVCSQFVKYARPFLTGQPTRSYREKYPKLYNDYLNFLVQLLLLAQQEDTKCWKNTIKFIQDRYKNAPNNQSLLLTSMAKSALIQYAKLLRGYQVAMEGSKGVIATFNKYSSRLTNMLRDPVSLYFVGEAVRALNDVGPEFYRRFAGKKGLTQEEKDKTLLNRILSGYLGNEKGPQGQDAIVFAREQADRIRFEAESTWFQRHKMKIYVASATAVTLSAYLIWKGFDEIREDFGAAEGFWKKAGVVLITPVSVVVRGVAQIGKTGYKQLEATAGIIKTKAGEFYAKMPSVRGRFSQALLEKAQRAWGGIKSGFGRAAGYFRRTPAGEFPIGTEVVVPAGDVSPETPVIAPVENVEPDAMVEPVGAPMVTTEILEEQGV